MALAVDSEEASNAGHYQNATTSGTNSWSLNNVAGTDILVWITAAQSGGSTAPTIATPTYNGVAMSSAGTFADATFSVRLSFFKLHAPATGANTVSYGFSGTGGSFLETTAGAISFTGGDPTTLTGTAVSAEDTGGASTTAAVSVTGTISGSIILSLVGAHNGVTSATAPNVRSWLLNTDSSTFGGGNGAMGRDPSSGGTVSPAFTVTAGEWFMLAVEVFAAPSNTLMGQAWL